MRCRTISPLVALFIETLFVACLSLAVWSDALASQQHSRLFREITERGSVHGRFSAFGDASFSVDAEKNQDMVALQFRIDDRNTVEKTCTLGPSHGRLSIQRRN